MTTKINDNPGTVPDSHLQNPIRIENRNLLITCQRLGEKGKGQVPNHIYELWRGVPCKGVALNRDSERLYGECFKDVYNEDYPVLPWVNRVLPKIWSTVLKFLETHNPFPDISLDLTTQPLTLKILQLFSIKQSWECMRLQMQKLRIDKSWSWKKPLVMPCTSFENCWLSQGYIIVQCRGSSEYWLMDYDQVMMICDTIIGRIFSILYLTLTSSNAEAKISPNILIAIYAQWDKLYSSYSNDSYLLLKNWEPLIQGIMLRDHDPLTYAGEFLKETLSPDVPWISIELQEMEKLVSSYSLNVHQLAELFGAYRHWGHPTVEERLGCKKVQKIAKSRSLPVLRTMKKAKATFSRQFCISFINEHGRWPRVDLGSLDKNSPLHTVVSRGLTSINFYSPRYPLLHWEHVEFLKEFEFDYFVDYTTLCEDKAISPYLDYLPSIYAPEVLGYKPLRPTSSRRILLELLRKKEVNVKQICDTVMRREVPDSWKIILVHAKEREMKIEPRLFAMFVLEVRLYFAATERNISHTIFRYFPQQTMTLSENELTKRLYNLGKEEHMDVSFPLYVSIDFKSWNLHWQYCSTVEIQKHLDNLFGTRGLYTYAHIFFSSAIISISSRFNPPNNVKADDRLNKGKKVNYNRFRNGLIEEDLCWTHHAGGFEGIIQKLWTLVTIILLLILELKTGIKSYIIGQGDNQFLKVLIPTIGTNIAPTREAYILSNQQYLGATIKTYIATLSEVAEDFRLVIKKEESWVSSCIINYGKEMLYKGAYLSQGLKRISRVLPDVNDLYPTLSTKISSMQTTGLATAQKSIDIWVGYVICQVETLLMIAREALYALLPGVTHQKRMIDWVVSNNGMNFLLHGDTHCFGIPVLNPLCYLFRGHPDPLTQYLTHITSNAFKCIWCKNILIWLIGEYYICGEGDPSILINDPLALNIKHPPQLGHLFKKAILKKVQAIVKNKELKMLFRINSEKEDEEFCRYLLDCDPIYPRLLHEIVRQTVTGTRLTVISKFSSARTVQQLLTRQELSQFYSKVILAEKSVIKEWMDISHSIDLVSRNKMLTQAPCPTNLASTLRNKTWSIATGGRPLNGVTVPYPTHQFCICLSNGLNHEACKGQSEFILMTIPNELSPLVCHTRGDFVPFHGHKTQEKQTGKIFQIPETSRPMKAAERLTQISQWCLLPTPNMISLIEGLIETRTDIPTNILNLTSGLVTSGSQVHRLNDHITKRGVLSNMRPNIASHIYLSTDNMGKYSRGSDNVNLHFQATILTGIMHLHCLALYKPTYSKGFANHIHFRCLECEEYIPEAKIDNPKLPPVIKKYGHNPLLFSSATDYPAYTTPDTLCFLMVKNGPPYQALATLLFCRILKNIGKAVWGISQKSKVFSNSISVRNVIDTGVIKVLDHLALLLCLYYFEKKDSLLHLVNLYSAEIWQDFGPACLLPETVKLLHEVTHESYQPQLFETRAGYVRLLNKALSVSINKCLNPAHIVTTRPIFYLGYGCGITRIFKMWGNLIYIISNGQVELRNIIKNMTFETNVGMNLPSKSSLDTVENYITNHPKSIYRETCWKIAPLKLSKTGPDASLGMTFVIKKDTKHTLKMVPRAVRPISYLNTTLVTYLECPIVENQEREISGLNHTTDCLDDSELPLKSFSDHQYHLVHNTSSAYLKVLQIILVFGISIVGPCVCLADGEGSISLMLHKLSKEVVFFNTLVDTTKILPHRGINYIPGEFIGSPEGVKLAELSALWGGDILNPKYRSIFIDGIKSQLQECNKEISLLTFDAEKNGLFSTNEQISLCTAVLTIVSQVHPKVMIYKCYCHDLTAISMVLDMIHRCYRRIVITVPIYSSNETYEAYLVCQEYYTDPGGSPMETLLGTSLSNCMPTHLKLLKTNRITAQPHQDNQPVWRDLCEIGKSLGFNSSLIYHLERLTDHLVVCNSKELDCHNLNKWLTNAQAILKDLVHKEWSGACCITRGDHIPTTTSLVVTSNTSIHTSLNRFIQAKLNCDILSDFLNYSTTQELCKHLPNLLTKRHTILNKNGKIFYDYRCSPLTFKRDTIRSLWVIWGHAKHN